MTYCEQCGRRVVIVINRKRNPGTYHHRKAKSLKGHGLCRQCFKTMMGSHLGRERAV